MRKALIIFVKNPEQGKVKTRLAAAIGDEKAFHIYKALLTHTSNVAKLVNADCFVYYSSFINETDEWNLEKFSKRLQTGDDLGIKMSDAFSDLFTAGYENICIIGSDCPAITDEIIDQAFAQLQNSDVVIGPAVDGGYYLLGLKKNHHSLFENIDWSTDKVLNQTMKTCNQAGLTTYLLAELSDIDNEDDLNRSDLLLTINKD